jgi:hypothetical protein
MCLLSVFLNRHLGIFRYSKIIFTFVGKLVLHTLDLLFPLISGQITHPAVFTAVIQVQMGMNM